VQTPYISPRKAAVRLAHPGLVRPTPTAPIVGMRNFPDWSLFTTTKNPFRGVHERQEPILSKLIRANALDSISFATEPVRCHYAFRWTSTILNVRSR